LRYAVDQHEAHVREFTGDFLHGLGLRETDGGDHVDLLARQAAHHLLGLGIAIGLDFEHFDAGLFGEALQAFESRLVERFVEFAARIVDHAELRLRDRTCGRRCQCTAGDAQRRNGHAELLKFHQ